MQQARNLGFSGLFERTFRAEAELLEQRLFGSDGYQNEVPTPASVAEVENESPA